MWYRTRILPIILVGALSLFFFVPAAAKAQNGLESQDLYQLRSVGEVLISPDGSQIAYTVINNERPGRPYSQIWIMHLESGEATRLGDPGEERSGPRWSPDGRWLAYMGRDQERSGLFIVRPDGSDITFLTEVRGSNHPLPSTGERITWSPDSRRVAYISAVQGPETEEAGGDPMVIRRYLYKTTGGDGTSYFNDNRRLHIFTVDIDTRIVRQLTQGDYYEHSIEWSPDGQEILFVSNREPNPDMFFNYDIFALRVADGSLRTLTQLESVVYRPTWSPDGKMIAYQGTKRGLTSSETTMEDTRVWVMNRDGHDSREVGASIDNRQGPPIWSQDGRFLYFTVLERGNIRLYRVPVGGGQPEVVVADPGRVTSVTVAGNQVAYGFEGRSDLAQLYLRTGKDTQQLTNLNIDVLTGKEIAQVEALTFVSFDGLEVEAFLTLPLGRTDSSTHPMIVAIKGGPHSQRGPSFLTTAQVYANQGYATLMVNYRGSTGYGQVFTDAIFGDQDGGEAMDVLQGTEAVLRRYPWIDRERLGIEGSSYGGQLTNWLITQTARFKAAIPRAGIADLISFNYLSYYHDYLAVEFGGRPHQSNLMDLLWERSALKHVAQVTTPTMLVHGNNDHNVPTSEAEQFFIALLDVGVEAVLVLYPREGHGFREISHQVDLIDRSINWYEKHFRSSQPTN